MSYYKYSPISLVVYDLCLQDMAQLIVERATLMNHLLPTEGNTSKRADLVLASMIDLFYNYLVKAQQPQEEAYSWVRFPHFMLSLLLSLQRKNMYSSMFPFQSNTQDQILLHWQNGKSATMNILVVHAMIILLTYGRPDGMYTYATDTKHKLQ